MMEAFPALSFLAEWPAHPEGDKTVYTGPNGQIVHGGPPGVGDNPDLDVIDWAAPPWLCDLYALHGGLGRFDRRVGWMRPSILPWQDVLPLTRFVRFGEENIGIDTADVVLFGPDGRGGGWVLEGRARPVVRWFDGQRHTLGPVTPRTQALGEIASGWISTPA